MQSLPAHVNDHHHHAEAIAELPRLPLHVNALLAPEGMRLRSDALPSTIDAVLMEMRKARAVIASNLNKKATGRGAHRHQRDCHTHYHH